MVEDQARLFRTAGPGAGLGALETILLSVGLWPAGTTARRVPVVAAGSIALTFVMPTAGLVGLLVEVPVAISATAIGWYAWLRVTGGVHDDERQKLVSAGTG
jgi:hypothetical protein